MSKFKKLIIILTVGLFLFSPLLNLGEEELSASLNEALFKEKDLVFFQQDTILGGFTVNSPFLLESLAEKQEEQIEVVLTGYSSSLWETDETPYITASGTWVREGIVANNLLPIGTKIKIPEIYGDKIFVVEDRMHPRKSYYHVDIWFASYWEALNFGAKKTYIEVLRS